MQTGAGSARTTTKQTKIKDLKQLRLRVRLCVHLCVCAGVWERTSATAFGVVDGDGKKDNSAKRK